MQNTAGDVAWASDNKTLFYVTRDEVLRPDKVCDFGSYRPATCSRRYYMQLDVTFALLSIFLLLLSLSHCTYPDAVQFLPHRLTRSRIALSGIAFIVLPNEAYPNHSLCSQGKSGKKLEICAGMEASHWQRSL